MEGTGLHKRGTSAEGWEAADSTSVAPILDGTGEGVPQVSENLYRRLAAKTRSERFLA